MTWFARKKRSVHSFSKCKDIIEAFLRKNGMDPNGQRISDGGVPLWSVREKNTLMYIFLNKYNGLNTVRIGFPILYLPKEKTAPFYRRCLEMNMGLPNCAMSISGDKVFVVSERPTHGLDSKLLQSMLDFMSEVSDDLDRKLTSEFDVETINLKSAGHP